MTLLLYKICAKCKMEKPVIDFRPKAHHYAYWCIPCDKLYHQQYYKLHQNKRKKQSKRWKQNHCIGVKKHSWSQKGIHNPDGSKFSIIDFDRLYQIQQGRCKICKKHSSELTKMLVPDHDHKTGIIRGLLCFGCNSGIGFFEDNINSLKSAIEYFTAI